MVDTLLEPVERKRKLVTHIDRAMGGGARGQWDMFSDLAGAHFANALVDRVTNAPALIGPGDWQPNHVYRHGAWEPVRQDSWTNDVTGFGTSLDKTMATNYRPSAWLSDGSLEALFAGDDITKRAICTAPKEMLRKGFFLELDGKTDKNKDTDIQDQWEELHMGKAYLRAMYWGSLYGDGAVVFGADDGRPSMLPLIPENVRRIEWVQAYDRRYYAINSYYQSGPKMGEPETYALGNPGAVTSRIQLVHETRMVRFGGAVTTDSMRQARGGFDASRLQEMYEVLRSFATGQKAVEVLLTDGPQGVYKIKGLQALLAGKNTSAFEMRLKLADMYRSAMRAVVVDSDSEDFTRQAIPLAGVSDILNNQMVRLAASVRMPVTKLFGTSAAGLNATGEGDARNWYDELETDQKNELGPKIRKGVQLLCAAKEGPTGGKPVKRLTVCFTPLWSLGPLEEAQRRLAIAQTDDLYHNMGVATTEEIALTRFGERGYNGESLQIDRKLRQSLIDDAGTDDETSVPPVGSLTPSSNEAITTVDEGRAMMNLPAHTDPEVGALMITEFKAKQEAATAPGSNPTDPELNKPDGHDVPDPADVPPPMPGGGPTGGPPAFGKGQAPPKGKAPFPAARRADWNEDQPRAENGEFGSGGGTRPEGHALARNAAARERHKEARGKLHDAKYFLAHVKEHNPELEGHAAKKLARAERVVASHEKDVARTEKATKPERLAQAKERHTEATKAHAEAKELHDTAQADLQKEKAAGSKAMAAYLKRTENSKSARTQKTRAIVVKLKQAIESDKHALADKLQDKLVERAAPYFAQYSAVGHEHALGEAKTAGKAEARRARAVTAHAKIAARRAK